MANGKNRLPVGQRTTNAGKPCKTRLTSVGATRIVLIAGGRNSASCRVVIRFAGWPYIPGFLFAHAGRQTVLLSVVLSIGVRRRLYRAQQPPTARRTPSIALLRVQTIAVKPTGNSRSLVDRRRLRASWPTAQLGPYLESSIFGGNCCVPSSKQLGGLPFDPLFHVWRTFTRQAKT